MSREDPAEERRRFELVGAAIAVVVVATIIGFFVAVIWRSGDDGSTPAASVSPTSTAEPSPIGVGEPRLLGPVELRSAPAPNVAIVTRVAETEAIRILGRSRSGEWLAITLVDRPAVSGWVLAAAVAGAQVAGLPIIEGMGEPGSPAPDGSLTPDLPDLIIDRVFADENHLAVRILNQGVADARGAFFVSVNGQEPVLLDVKPGEALRPGQALEARVPGEYVQLRTAVSLVLVPDPERPEESDENNSWEGIVEPDQPLDVEIVRAAVRETDRHLLVDIRNNSTIPVIGTFTVSVREALPSTELMGRRAETMEIGPSETVEFEFEALRDVDLTRVTITLSSNAIDDANLANNTYPR